MTNSEKSLVQKEILDVIPDKPHGRLLLAPRLGKTKLIIDIIKKNNPKSILWVTPLAKLAEEDIPNEFNTWKAKKYLSRLTTITWTSLNTIKGHYEMIVFDEEQFITVNNSKAIREGETTYDYIVSMTGTRTKDSDKIELYNHLNLNVIFELDINDAVNLGILANYNINVIKLSMSFIKNIEAGSKTNKFMTSEYSQYAYLTKVMETAIKKKDSTTMHKILNRTKAIYNSATKTNYAAKLLSELQGRKMLFCSSIDQAETLTNSTYHSKTDGENLKKFMNGENDTLAMVHAGGVGTTFKNVDHLILVQADSDRNGLTSQKICRTLLHQPDYTATIWILCLLNTQDEQWVNSTLENFDSSKIKYFNVI
jgi:superfamily II DNA or RNA helicase